MIAKRIDREHSVKDQFRCLGLYIADASHDGEKLLEAWHTGCVAENYKDALMEIELTQDMNSVATKGKTYHLILSFRPEDEIKLNAAVFREIETAVAAALGFEEYQRACGVHKNTDNMHMHIAYNMIHPEKFTKYEPFRDFNKLSEVCRELEKKYDLAIDNGMDKNKEPTRINQKVGSMEAHTGQQSFQSYVLERKSFVLDALARASSWQDLHEALAIKGIAIKLQGNGLAIINSHGKGAIKGSTIDRSCSKAQLEKRFGPFVAGKNLQHIPVQEKYSAKPLQKSPDRDNLYKEYLHAMKLRQERLHEIKALRQAESLSLRAQWSEEYKQLRTRILGKSTRRKLMQQLKNLQRERYTALNGAHNEKLDAIRQEYPFNNWNSFLKIKAEHGHKTALAILRSKKSEVAPETQSPTAKIPGKCIIDNKGTIIITLPSGGTIRDTGKEIHFSAHDREVEKMALKYAKEKWGVVKIAVVCNKIKPSKWIKKQKYDVGR